MNELSKNNSKKEQISKRKIENVSINFSGYVRPKQAIPIILENGEVVLLTNIMEPSKKSRIVLQDLKGNELDKILYLGWDRAYMTKDDENVYVFTTDTRTSKFYKFDAKTLQKKATMPLGESEIQGVVCNDENIFTFDMKNGKVETRDKDGNILSTIDTIERTSTYTKISNQLMYATSKGIHFVDWEDVGIDDELRHKMEENFGEEFMQLNKDFGAIAYDEQTQTTYVGARNLVFVANLDGIKGVMYFKDKDIISLDIDSRTQSLAVSSSNWPETDESYPMDEGGNLEIIPLDMVNDKIKSSMEYLYKRNQQKCMKNIEYEITEQPEIPTLVKEYEEKQTELLNQDNEIISTMRSAVGRTIGRTENVKRELINQDEKEKEGEEYGDN